LVKRTFDEKRASTGAFNDEKATSSGAD